MTESFRCPSCHAPLTYEEGASVVQCAYCGNSAIVPEALRPRPPEPPPTVRINVSAPVVVPRSAARGGCALTLVILTVVLLATGGIIYGALSTIGVEEPFTGIVEQLETIATPNAAFTLASPTPQPTATPGVGRELLTFGGEGTGVGRLDDAREIGVDAAGNVYVADYSSGRIQRFNAAGEHQSQWMVVNDLNPVTSMKVARDGTVYVAQGFEIHRYEGATGTHLGTITYPSDFSLVLEDVAPLPDGGLLVNERGERLVWLDAGGNVVRTAEVPERERGSQFERVAVDGQGNVYALGLLGERGRLEEGVFRYDSGGQYLSFFGGSGDEPGQFRAADSIAVDGQGRVYVSSFQGVQIFDPRGRYLATIEVPGVAFGMAFDAEDHLWVTNRESVFEMEIQDIE